MITKRAKRLKEKRTMPASIQIPEELANRLKPLGDRIPQIIELGWRG